MINSTTISMTSIGQTLSCFIPIFANLRSDGDDSPAASCKRRVDRGLNLGDPERVA